MASLKPCLDGAKILITGASSGIGEEFARALATRASKLILVARRLDRLEKLKSELQKNSKIEIKLMKLDLTSAKAREELAQEAGEVDIVINNAGMGDIEFFEKANWGKLEQMITLNVMALTHLTHLFLPQMISRKKGAVLFVGSSAGFQSMPGFGAYSATKYFVRGLADALRAELAPAGIAIAVLCPGPVHTEFAEVATSGSRVNLPVILEIDSAKCVRIALRDFERGRYLLLPGIMPKLAWLLSSISPYLLISCLTKWMARKVRNTRINQ